MKMHYSDYASDEQYRICVLCGADCIPEPTETKGYSIRIIFVCPNCGPNSVVEPFKNSQ